MAAVQRWLMPPIRACGLMESSSPPNPLPPLGWVAGRVFDKKGLIIFLFRFVKVLVIEIFSSVLGLFGLIIGLLVSSKAPEFE